MIQLITTGFLQVFFVAINTWLITKQQYVGVIIVSFLISFIWSFNVKKVAFGTMKDRLVYSLGAALGGLTGLLIGQLFTA
ncbi:hypothetical protein [Sphingobacterium multivorum]|uniref:Uncharacterized protein n=1 Tax=Sphingobacterium multivorum TaxID=28454 RepID=A0A654D0S6_SPHMU|nr:hypothetical protein [Sphingobacterium multivorum]VXC99432.1 conserved membrane hypothetical protein [Sphingobacterium multivorum]